MLVNTKTLEEISEWGFRNMVPDASFPPELTNEIILPYGHAVLQDTPPTTPLLKKAVRDGVVEVEGQYSVEYRLVDFTPEEVAQYLDQEQRRLTGVVTQHINQIASSRNYDDIVSLCSFATSTDPVFGKEGKAAITWRDSVWNRCYTIGGAVRAGERPAPTDAELISELPVFTWGE